jgi:hypothetical protein
MHFTVFYNLFLFPTYPADIFMTLSRLRLEIDHIPDLFISRNVSVAEASSPEAVARHRDPRTMFFLE